LRRCVITARPSRDAAADEEVESVEETPDNGVVANLKSKKKVAGEGLLYLLDARGTSMN